METLLQKPLKKVRIKLKDYIFFVSQGKTENYYCEDGKKYIYRAVITVVYKENISRFFFHGSINDYQNGKMYYTKKEFPFLLYCFVSDAHIGQESFDDFCDNLGYDNDSRKAEKIFKLCKKSTEKAYKLGIETDQDFCDILNELSGKYDC